MRTLQIPRKTNKFTQPAFPQVGAGEDLDLVLTKLAVSESTEKMVTIDGSTPGKQ